MNPDPNILLIGVGAVGASIAGWLAPHYPRLTLLARGDNLAALNAHGIRLYQQGSPTPDRGIAVKSIANLAEMPTPDVIFLCVKNYSLDALCQQIKDTYGDAPIIVGFQNGSANQQILPRYFSKVVYGIVYYNAWLDEPGLVGYQKCGPLALGTPDNSLMAPMTQLAALLSCGVPTHVTRQLNDAIVTKIIINLTNSFTTLIGFPHQTGGTEDQFQRILANLLYEGTRIAKAAGHKESQQGGMPSWTLLKLAAIAPLWLTRPLFRKNVKKMVISSMAQDVIQHHRGDSELDDINGHMIRLADQHGVAAPYNRAVYQLCQKTFAQAPFTPMPLDAVWLAIEAEISCA